MNIQFWNLVSIIKKLTSSDSKLKFYDLPENDPKVRKPNIDLALRISKLETKNKLEDGLRKLLSIFIIIK